ncbi:NTPase [Emticicia sp. CRIBPO]|uniref:KAP family P-loop NTPase fold protein n=1 Tax=Emticicia sp. CRIBPO TaxID=2683258 RepID=UPI001412CE8C|nr:P-loop NTPase fold protein [Emticicia sp. CRIBPO]NBA88436.1 NTPase [Emticicia sp. CRIBPO]
MKIKHSELEISNDKPFENCVLGRENYANILTGLIQSYSDGFVLAINNEWGTGKTTFVKMWQQSMQNKAFKTLYFNAWENDFDKSPLVAIMSELKTLFNVGKNEATFKSIAKKAALLQSKIAPALIKAILAKYFDLKEFNDVLEKTADAGFELFENEITEYAEKKKGLIEFREELTKFIKDVNSGSKPLVFIIDELDRCRPDYAVELLENIKHFFNIPGIVFVLAIDKKQLGNAIRGYYGSDLIDADEYLRRFIDIEYSLPNPDTLSFCKYLYKYFAFINSPSSSRYSDSFLNLASSLFEKSNFSLRQQEKVFAHTRIVLRSLNNDTEEYFSFIFILICIKIISPEFYRKIQNKELSMQELSDSYFDFIPKNFNINTFIDKADDPRTRQLIFIEAQLVLYYSKFIHERASDFSQSIFLKGSKSQLTFKSKFDTSEENKELMKKFTYLNDSRLSELSIGYFLDRINLLEHSIS